MIRLKPLAIIGLLWATITHVAAIEPSFDCRNNKLNAIETLICQDPNLSQLDNQLAEVYKQAVEFDQENHATHNLRSEQRGWIKGRDECWKDGDPNQCVKKQYIHRVANLQARYRLVEHSQPSFYSCDGVRAKEVVVTRFDTNPPSLIAEFGDRVAFMLQQPKQENVYHGRNESVRYLEDSSAEITWGYQSPLMLCRVEQ